MAFFLNSVNFHEKSHNMTTLGKGANVQLVGGGGGGLMGILHWERLTDTLSFPEPY